MRYVSMTYVAVCDCGWTGRERSRREGACADLPNHDCTGGDSDLAVVVDSAKKAAFVYLRQHPAAWTDADSIISDAYLGALHGWQRYEAAKGAGMSGWCYGKARYQILDGIRDRSHLSRSAYKNPSRVPVWSKEPMSLEWALTEDMTITDLLIDETAEAAFDHVDTIDALKRVMVTLQPKERQIVQWYYWDGMTFAEIGRMLDVTESYAWQLHRRALGRMRDELSE